MSPRPKVDPRQRDGLALATPRRVRIEVDATPWELLSRECVRRAERPLLTVALRWSPLGAEGQPATAYRSSPLDVAHGPACMEAVRSLGLAHDAVRSLPALCWAHVARVRYPDGHTVAFGLSVRPRDLAHVEAEGFPFARVDGHRVLPWGGFAAGHTDAEVLAAHEFVRGRTIAADAAAGAGR